MRYPMVYLHWAAIEPEVMGRASTLLGRISGKLFPAKIFLVSIIY
jgi:hypothetical protein